MSVAAVHTADDALQALREHADELSHWQNSDLNESDTRSKIIDTLLLQVLGWDEASIRREVRTANGGYSDYVVQNERTAFVLEAKRAGHYFEMPTLASREAARNGVLAQSRELKAALDQVVTYCRAQGHPVGAVSNGLQLALTLPFHDGSGTHDTIFFNGIGDIERHFIEFWNLFSPQGQCLDTLRRRLSAPRSIRVAPEGAKVLRDQLVMHTDEPIDRNPITGAIDPILRHYFEDIVSPDKRTILEKGYVESARQAQYGRQVDELLSGSIPHLNVRTSRVATTRRTAPQLDAKLGELVSEVDEGRPEGAVTLVVGGVGAGKTTFLRRYFEFLAPDELRSTVIPVFVDFIDVAEDANDIGPLVDVAIQTSLRDNYPEFDLDSWETIQQIYRSEVARYQNGLLKPLYQSDRAAFEQRLSEELGRLSNESEPHTGRLLRYLRSQRQKTVCLVLDNGDQLPPARQAEILRLAFQRARSWDVVVLMALRGETFWQFRNQPPLDAYHRQALQVPPPRLANVLSRRLELAKSEVVGQEISFEISIGSVVQVPLADFLQVLVDSFLGREESQTRLFLESLAAGDVRHGLDLFTTFLRSGHTNTNEYFKLLVETGRYAVPLHHLIRGVAFGDYRFYDSSKSLIANVFSIEDDGFYSHFTKLRLLRHLYEARNVESLAGKGYVEVAGLFRSFQGIVSDEAGLRAALHPLLQQKLVEASNGHRVGGDLADFVRVTSGGQYYSDRLCKTFAYLDLASTDTPIRSIEMFNAMANIPVDRARVDDRIRRVETFVEYLRSEEEAEGLHLNDLPIATSAKARISDEISAALTAELPRVRRGVERRRA